MVSKYILAIKNKHIFNPAALAVAHDRPYPRQICQLVDRRQPANDGFRYPWRTADRKESAAIYMVGAFFLAAIVAVMATYSGNALAGIPQLALHTPIFFFAFIMLTEPITTPPTMWLRVAYGAFVGLFFAPTIHIGPIYSTPELALVVGNVFSYLVSPRRN